MLSQSNQKQIQLLPHVVIQMASLSPLQGCIGLLHCYWGVGIFFPTPGFLSTCPSCSLSVSDRDCCCLWRNSVLIALSSREWQAQRIKDKNINLTTSSSGAISSLPTDRDTRLKGGGEIYWEQVTVYEEWRNKDSTLINELKKARCFPIP